MIYYKQILIKPKRQFEYCSLLCKYKPNRVKFLTEVLNFTGYSDNLGLEKCNNTYNRVVIVFELCTVRDWIQGMIE